jgi:TonB family protein
VVVDLKDPAFERPTKPIGPVYPRREAEHLATTRLWTLAADGEGVRRVVASPQPQRVLGLDPMRWLLAHGVVLIAAGGGGIAAHFPSSGPHHTVPAASTPGTRPTSPSGNPGSSGTAQGGTPGGSGRKPAASGVPGGKGRMPQPPYPSFARSRGLQGTVVVSISAAPDGSVTSASVARSSGSPDLDRYAVSWIRSRWRMPAGTTSGQQTIHFRLR